MIDNFSLGLTHGLMLLAAWLLLRRPDLDDERAGTGERTRRWLGRRGGGDRPGA
ncbi:hypothetical protein ACNI3Q_10675 [Sphingomonas sp. FW199]|uniref:hypothetical protein n=1 Tax=unclassified Sphingomonas TaxID=196159 RepID=UPI0021A431D4|nr:hypothetical protein [Sphingomonas sp. BGYR3]MDG5489812.1 hypothetical protein [Sphingomonas sp. BGYR3]